MAGFFKRLFKRKKKQSHSIDESKKTSNPKTQDTEHDGRKYHISLNHDENSEYHNYWRVRKSSSEKTIKYFKTQNEAIEYAKSLAHSQDSSIIIHKKDGSMRKQNY